LLVGASFRTAPLAVRERIAARLDRDDNLGALKRAGALESSVIKTCNRLELYLTTRYPEITAESVIAMLSDGKGSSEDFYVKLGVDAIAHIFRVASGLDSLVVGEEQILQQVRDSGRRARVSGTARSVISPLFDTAYNVGRRVRSLPGAPSKSASVSAFALKYALRALGRQPRKVLLIGTGETAKLAALELKSSTVYLLSRRRGIHSRFPGTTIITQSMLRRAGAECGLIIAATRHRGYVLKRGDLPDARKKVVLDLGFPRNVDPALKSSRLIHLFDLDDLAAHARLPNGATRSSAERLAKAEAERFYRWLTATRLNPMLANIYRWAESIREDETGLALRRLPRLSGKDRRVLEAMSRRLVSKLMAPHAAFVKRQEEVGQTERLRLLESIFGREAGR